MRKLIVVAFSVTLAFSQQVFAEDAPAQKADDSCPNAQTQRELDDCAETAYKTADAEMTSIYKQVLAKFAEDKKFIAKFRAAQRAWLKFRDAEIDAMFPHDENAQEDYGTVYPMCNSFLLADITRERTKQLKKWLAGTEEGEVCGGSLDGPVTDGK